MTEQQNAELVVRKDLMASPLANVDDDWINPLRFEQLQRGAAMLSKSNIVPDAFKDKVPDCFAVMAMARCTGMNVFQAFQALYVVHGRIGWYSKALIAQANASGKLKNGIKYRMTGERGKPTWGCIAYATMKDGETIEGTEVTMAMADGEGWFTKNGSKWRTMPELMLKYRAASFFISQHCPEVQFGLPTVEEIEDVEEPVDRAAASEKLRAVEAEITKRSDAELHAGALAEFQKHVSKLGESRVVEILGSSDTSKSSTQEIWDAIDVLLDASRAGNEPPAKSSPDAGVQKKRGRGANAAVPPPPPITPPPASGGGPTAAESPVPTFLKAAKVIEVYLADQRISGETRKRLEALYAVRHLLGEADDVRIAQAARLETEGKPERFTEIMREFGALV